MQILTLTTLAEIRQHADDWDDLWQRSESALPTLRANLTAQWIEHFAPAAPLRVVTIAENGRWVAALPLVEKRLVPGVRVGALPTDCWSSSGDLLIDPATDVATVLDVLVDELSILPWPLLWLDATESDGPRWTAFREALARAGRPTARHGQYHVGVVDIDHSWDAYQTRWSSNHRHAVRKSRRRLDAEGELRFVSHRDVDDEGLEDLLRQGFEVEDRSWKGTDGTSVLRTPGMFDFFLQQARQLAAWDQLRLDFVYFDGWPIAFEFCYDAKGVCYSHKIGYDEAFGQFGPGRLIRAMQLEQLFEGGDHRLFDTMGILCESKARWCTRSYPVERLVASCGGLTGRLLTRAYDRLWPKVRRLRISDDSNELPKLGALPRIAEAETMPTVLSS